MATNLINKGKAMFKKQENLKANIQQSKRFKPLYRNKKSQGSSQASKGKGNNQTSNKENSLSTSREIDNKKRKGETNSNLDKGNKEKLLANNRPK